MLATPEPVRPAHVCAAIRRLLKRCVTNAARPAWLRLTLCLMLLALTGAFQAAFASTTPLSKGSMESCGHRKPDLCRVAEPLTRAARLPGKWCTL
jgi:hypothetical protein